MTYTPVELRHVRVSRSLFGYRPGAVQELLANPGYREAAGRLRHEMRSAPTVAEMAANVPKWVSSYREGERTWTTSACAG